jgi:6-phosphofructokinase 1
MARPIRRIAINTGGGDAPGLNAVIRAVVLSAGRLGWEVVGIKKGYLGLLDPRQVLTLSPESVRGIAHLGGTILGTSNRGSPFEFPVEAADGTAATVDRSDEVVAGFHRLGLDALIAIGGDGSMKIAHGLAAKGIPVVGVPKTIDNDLEGTVVTFGFDTATTVATEAIDRLHSTAEAHERVFVVEVMGRYAGWIALESGIAGGADVILLPEIPYRLAAVCRKIGEREARGRHFSIVVAAEGAHPAGGERIVRGPREPGREVRLGGIGERLAEELAGATGKETRSVVLGHLQRGGRPTPRDRLLALRFGAAAVRMIAERRFSVMVALDPPEVSAVPLSSAIRRMKCVPLDCDTLATARQMGLCLGDEAGP